MASVSRHSGANVILLASITSEGMGLCPAVEAASIGEVRGHPEVLSGARLEAGATRGDGRSLGAQGSAGVRACQGAWLRAVVPATLLAGLQPHRASLLEGQGTAQRVGARTREALAEAAGRTLDAVTASDARGFFEGCGYRTTAQHDRRFTELIRRICQMAQGVGNVSS